MDKLAPKDNDSALLAGLSHLVSIMAMVIGPAVIYFVKKDDDYVRYNALQSLFVDIAFFAVWMAGFVVTFVSFFTIILPFLLIPLMFLVYFAFVIGKIVLAYRAYKGIETDIPFVTPYVKDHLGKRI